MVEIPLQQNHTIFHIQQPNYKNRYKLCSLVVGCCLLQNKVYYATISRCLYFCLFSACDLTMIIQGEQSWWSPVLKLKYLVFFKPRATQRKHRMHMEKTNMQHLENPVKVLYIHMEPLPCLSGWLACRHIYLLYLFC